MRACPHCGLSVATTQQVIDCAARYADTQGGHNDRHTLVIEAAERAASDNPSSPGKTGDA